MESLLLWFYLHPSGSRPDKVSSRKLLRRLKQIVRALLLAVAVSLSASCLWQYVREQLFLWPAREEGAGLHLLFEPRLWIFRLSPADGGKIAWWFASTGEPTEGSQGIFVCPSWPVAAVAAGVLVYAVILILEPGGRWLQQRAARINDSGS